MLAEKGHRVIFVTPGDEVGGWSRWTHDQWYGQKRLIELGVEIRTARYVTGFDSGAATTLCTYSGRDASLEAGSLIAVGARRPKDALYQSLAGDPGALSEAGIRSLQRIGDCEVPGAVVHAVYAGHKLAREFDEQPNRDAPFKLERAVVGL
jgi:dimethylamine/trimethylamine dehydrogenase